MFPNAAEVIPNHSSHIDNAEANGFLTLGCDAIALAAGLVAWNQRNETAGQPSLEYQEAQPEISYQTYEDAVTVLRAACRLLLYNTDHLKPDCAEPLPAAEGSPPQPQGQAGSPPDPA